MTPKKSDRGSHEPLAAGGRELRLKARPPAGLISRRRLKKAPKSPTRPRVAPLFQTGSLAIAQDDPPAKSSLKKDLLDLRLGPFDLHPRLSAGLILDDNILYSSANKEADAEWVVQPALQAVAGDDAALIAFRDQHNDVLSLSPGSLIVQQTENWPGKLLILDYGPRFQIFSKYTANNSIDQFATVSLLWPMDKLILSFKQDYQFQKMEIIEFNQRTTVENIPTTLSAAYQFGDRTSMESDLRRFSVGYQTQGLIGYTEYNNENWFNYNLEEDLPVSLGVLAGQDIVANHQDQTYEQLRGRARYYFTEKLAFDVSAGGELREYENGKSDTLSPVFTVASQFRPAERTSLSLAGSREQSSSIYNGYNYASTGATFDVRQEITDRFTADLSAGYYSLDYTPINSGLVKRSGDYYLARISLEAKISPRLTSQLFYQFLNSHAQNSASVNDNQTGIQVTFSF